MPGKDAAAEELQRESGDFAEMRGVGNCKLPNFNFQSVLSLSEGRCLDLFHCL